MAETVAVPGVKKPMPKWAVFAGVGGLAVAIYLYYKNKSSSAAAAPAAPAATTTDQYPPDGTTGNPSDPYSTDPATGQTYGDEAAGSGAGYGAYGSGTGYGTGSGWDSQTGMYTDPNGNQCTNPGADGYCPGSGTGGPPFSDNAAWSQWVITTMTTSNPSLDVQALTDALGLYLAGQPVDAAQKTYALDAEAIGGPPPVAGPGGYPPNLRLNGSKGPGAGPVNPVPGFRVASKTATSATFAWDRDPATKTFDFVLKDGATVKSSRPALSALTTDVTASGLRKGQRYTATLRALPQATGSRQASLTFTL